MGTVKEQLVEAIRDLGLGPAQAALYDSTSAAAVIQRAKAAFVIGDPSWWWTALKVPATTYDYPGGDGLQHLFDHLPEGRRRAWLVVESDDDNPPPVLDVVLAEVPSILRRCEGVEYYLVGRQFDWLICENHHNQVIVALHSGAAAAPCERPDAQMDEA